jgi:hypothetical protein
LPLANFTISDVLYQRIGEYVDQKGFSSKAEFYRFAVIHYMECGSVWLNRKRMSYKKVPFGD